ncbi:alpha/beta-hydrolase [Auriculariales sp. MPI-PUGE-AT-0066]|nr:alpha/beta-hydrolase [Auriculariales sp. MPI-PUGE-AT-0066]
MSTQYTDSSELPNERSRDSQELRVEGRLGRAPDRQTISQDTYDELVHYYKHASQAYTVVKHSKVNGARLIVAFVDIATDAQGYIAVDDERKDIVVVFRGTQGIRGSVMDSMIRLEDIIAPKELPGVQVHHGFQSCWMAVSPVVVKHVQEQVGLQPGYTLVAVGHSLGGAMASIASVTFKQLSPQTRMKLLTYGQPRAGNALFTQTITDLIGKQEIFRVVHSNDGVPTMVPTELGYVHHGIEYWAWDPPSPECTYICNAAGDYEEDPNGSTGVPSAGVNMAHLTYFGHLCCYPFFTAQLDITASEDLRLYDKQAQYATGLE